MMPPHVTPCREGAPTTVRSAQNRHRSDFQSSLLSRLFNTSISTKTSIQCSLRVSNVNHWLLWIVLLIALSMCTQFSIYKRLVLEETSRTVLSFPHVPAEKLKLRYDWTNLERRSALAQRMAQMQSNCSSTPGHFWYRNRFGLGSDLHVYSVALCNALQMGDVRVKTLPPWTWFDEQSCAGPSPMTCYFPESEPSCPKDPLVHFSSKRRTMRNLTRPAGKIRESCPDVQALYGGVAAVRAAATEFLFTRVSALVFAEAQRQLQRVFHHSYRVPEHLITVHIRWGDKSDEMALVPIAKYIDAVQQILDRRQPDSLTRSGVHVFLSTEDPEAYSQFLQAAPDYWNIYVDEYFYELLPHRKTTANASMYNSIPQMAQALHGRPGILALGSLLVAMEANDFVLTTASNWSRLMNEIRLNIINPRCNNCTTMIDLKHGEW